MGEVIHTKTLLGLSDNWPHSPNSLILSISLSELDSSSPNCRQIPVDLIGRPLTLDTLVLISSCISRSLNSSMAGGGSGELVGEGGTGDGDKEYGASSSIVGV